jgi:hypothetical protein
MAECHFRSASSLPPCPALHHHLPDPPPSTLLTPNTSTSATGPSTLTPAAPHSPEHPLHLLIRVLPYKLFQGSSTMGEMNEDGGGGGGALRARRGFFAIENEKKKRNLFSHLLQNFSKGVAQREQTSKCKATDAGGRATSLRLPPKNKIATVADHEGGVVTVTSR